MSSVFLSDEGLLAFLDVAGKRGTIPRTTAAAMRGGAVGFQTSFPVRPGTVVTLLNIPSDLTKAEAERLAQFIKMLGVER